MGSFFFFVVSWYVISDKSKAERQIACHTDMVGSGEVERQGQVGLANLWSSHFPAGCFPPSVAMGQPVLHIYLFSCFSSSITSLPGPLQRGCGFQRGSLWPHPERQGPGDLGLEMGDFSDVTLASGDNQVM